MYRYMVSKNEIAAFLEDFSRGTFCRGVMDAVSEILDEFLFDQSRDYYEGYREGTVMNARSDFVSRKMRALGIEL